MLCALAFIEHGVFIRPIGNIVYLTPAFTISASELKTLTDAVVKTVRELKIVRGKEWRIADR